MKAKKLPCGCKLVIDRNGAERIYPLNMCPLHHIEWEAHHAAAVNEHARASTAFPNSYAEDLEYERAKGNIR